MPPLPTEATIGATKVSTNRRHSFHTCNDHSRFRQYGFAQQSFVDDVERRLGNLEWKGVIEILTPLLQSKLLGDFDILMTSWFPYTAVQANLLVSELFFVACHHSEKLQFGLGCRPKICAVHSLNCSPFEQIAVIIVGRMYEQQIQLEPNSPLSRFAKRRLSSALGSHARLVNAPRQLIACVCF